MPIVATTASVEETRLLGEAVATLASPGDVVVLAGDLGAGKTAFVQGFGRGLGVQERITSPTFTLVHVYDGRLAVHHLDVYRLEHLSEASDLGLAEMLDDGGVVLIEWGDAIARLLPHDHLDVRLTFGADDDDRVIELVPVGPHWARRTDALLAALQPWAGGG
ncbi:MAG: tRNA (adenosine(37)-N6)-threonylcarbamoyltransferase complex ATPase subunit type 1 TsaE [Acidimicrobiia bacterium]|nr:tRNA (adenosine(37)-N6)-threonylcarbamoyltransferase complex ATPase subunit type 1 TsaE [Acidimicrobiia bacterium]